MLVIVMPFMWKFCLKITEDYIIIRVNNIKINLNLNLFKIWIYLIYIYNNENIWIVVCITYYRHTHTHTPLLLTTPNLLKGLYCKRIISYILITLIFHYIYYCEYISFIIHLSYYRSHITSSESYICGIYQTFTVFEQTSEFIR